MKRTKKFKYFFAGLIFLFAILPAIAQLQETTTRPVYRIVLSDDIINPATEEYIIKSIETAEKNKAELLILELDTPGGLLTSTRAIVKKIMGSTVPIATYVAPSGSRAGSAGVFITMASHIAAMAPSTNIGAAHPVSIQEKRSSGDAFDDLLKSLTKKDDKNKKPKEPPADTMEKKILNDTVAWAEAIAKTRSRNEVWAVKAVTESVSVTEQDALNMKVIDLIATDTKDLLAKIDGKKIVLAAGEITLKTKDATITELPKSIRLQALTILAHPTIAYILLMCGIYGLLFEFTHPGVTFPGIAGVICLILAGFGLHMLPTNYAGIALIIVALILFIAEIKVTSYGLLTIGGIITMFLGSLILFSSPYKFMRVSIPVIGAFTLSTLIIASFLTTLVVRSHRKRVRTGMEGLVGETGEVISWDGPHGKVFVHGEIWDAACDSPLEKDINITVTKVEGMKLVVRKS